MDFLMNLIQLGLDAGILALCCEVVFRQKAEIKAKEFFIFPIFLVICVVTRMDFSIGANMTASFRSEGFEMLPADNIVGLLFLLFAVLLLSSICFGSKSSGTVFCGTMAAFSVFLFVKCLCAVLFAACGATDILLLLGSRVAALCLTSGAASCYPFTSYEMCDDNGILLGVNKHNNSLIIVDIFDSRVYKNANISILGTSGAGKTFTMQLMALRMRRKGIQVFIVAPLKGHEFHRACSNIGGQFISISPASQNCINIMEIRKADKSVDDLLDGPGVEKSLLAAKIQRLHTFFSLLIPDMSHEERQLLDDAMICTYGTKGITHDNASLEQPEHPGHYKEMPILGDLYEILAASPETKRLANILNRLVNGSARSFNQQTNVALDNKYIVLDISELTGDLLTVGMFVALDFVWDKAKENRTAEKAIFVDECWQLIGASSNRQAAESVLELAKTIRGYGGSLVCATQDLNDFFALDDGKYGKGIINNSKTKILLNLEEEEAQRVQGVLHLSEAELMEITHFERGSALISTNNNNIAVEIKCSQMEKDLITTDRRELAELAQRAATKQNPS